MVKNKMTVITKVKLYRNITTVIFSILIMSGCLFSNKMGIPTTIQDMLVVLASCVLGGINGAGATGIFIIVGCLGLPVFSSDLRGFEIFSGPSAGYIIGYFFSSILSGLIMKNPSVFEDKINLKSLIKTILCVILSFVIIFVSGFLWYHNFINLNMDSTLQESFNNSVKIFIPNTIVKIILTIILTLTLRPLIAKILYPKNIVEEEEKEFFDKLKNKLNKGKEK